MEREDPMRLSDEAFTSTQKSMFCWFLTRDPYLTYAQTNPLYSSSQEIDSLRLIYAERRQFQTCCFQQCWRGAESIYIQTDLRYWNWSVLIVCSFLFSLLYFSVGKLFLSSSSSSGYSAVLIFKHIMSIVETQINFVLNILIRASTVREQYRTHLWEHLHYWCPLLNKDFAVNQITFIGYNSL